MKPNSSNLELNLENHERGACFKPYRAFNFVGDKHGREIVDD
jgi:hypothetical protein